MLTAPFSEDHAADPFGDWPQWRKDMGLGPHRGQDWNDLDEGTPIPASGTGTVTLSQWNNVLGWEVVVYYPSDEVYIGYCHLYQRGPTEGTGLHRGDTVGRLGNTGSASTGAHLHMTASRQDGDPGTVPVIDPMQFMSFSSKVAGGAGNLIIPISESEEDDMILLNVTDSVDGNNIPGWALLNTRTGKTLTLRADDPKNRERANGWARVWGNARKCVRQDLLNAIDAIKKTG